MKKFLSLFIVVAAVIILSTLWSCAYGKQMGNNFPYKLYALKTWKSMSAWKCIGNNNLNKQFILGYDYIMGIPVQLEKNIYLVRNENTITYFFEYYDRDGTVFYESLTTNYDLKNLSLSDGDTLKYDRFTAIPASSKEFNRYLKRYNSYFKKRGKALLKDLTRKELSEYYNMGYSPEVCDDTLESWLSIMGHPFEYNLNLLNAIIRENRLDKELAIKIYNWDIHLFLKYRKLQLTQPICPAPQNPDKRAELPFPKIRRKR